MHRWTAMHIRTRKLIGTVALFVLVTAWALLAMALAQSPTLAANRWLATLYYAVAGLGWVLPAMPLVWWMVRPDAPDTKAHLENTDARASPRLDSGSNQHRASPPDERFPRPHG
jgi:hypothetical protein